MSASEQAYEQEERIRMVNLIRKLVELVEYCDDKSHQGKTAYNEAKAFLAEEENEA